LEHCKRRLLKWSKNRGRQKRLAWLRKKTDRIKSLQARVTPDSEDEIRQNQAAIDAKLEQEDLKWKQRAKVSLASEWGSKHKILPPVCQLEMEDEPDW
jgi:hypothetical protein